MKTVEDITDADFEHGKKLCKVFERNNLGKWHDLDVQRDILLLADVLEHLPYMCLEIYELDIDCFLTAPDLALEFKND